MDRSLGQTERIFFTVSIHLCVTLSALIARIGANSVTDSANGENEADHRSVCHRLPSLGREQVVLHVHMGTRSITFAKKNSVGKGKEG